MNLFLFLFFVLCSFLFLFSKNIRFVSYIRRWKSYDVFLVIYYDVCIDMGDFVVYGGGEKRCWWCVYSLNSFLMLPNHQRMYRLCFNFFSLSLCLFFFGYKTINDESTTNIILSFVFCVYGLCVYASVEGK